MKIQQVKSNFIIIILLVICLIPSALALWYYYHPGALPKAQINKGMLITPPILLSNIHKNNHAQFSLILLYPNKCTKNCHNIEKKLLKIRLSLGRHFYDVNQEVISVNIKKLSMKSGIFIMDKYNYLILYYKLNSDINNIYMDLCRLLKK